MALMNYFKMKSVGMIGTKVVPIEIECVQQRRMPYLQIIGGPSGAIGAQRERVMAALDSSGFRLPAKRVTVSVTGTVPGMCVESTDLAVALCILGSSSAFPQGKIKNAYACGSLSLDGSLVALKFRAPLRAWLESCGEFPLFLPWDDSFLLTAHQNGGGFHNLGEVVAYLRQEQSIGPRLRFKNALFTNPETKFWRNLNGRPIAQRLAQVSAAGLHPTLVTGGAEGCAKSIAEAVLCLFPPLDPAIEEEVGSIHRSFGEVRNEYGSRPFREIRSHQAARLLRFDSSNNLWGEISLAHGGMLFLSDLGEKPASLMQKLQEPMEAGAVRFFRGGQCLVQPADWSLFAKVSLCPCGGSGAKDSYCRCPLAEKEKFRKRLDLVRPLFQLRYQVEEAGGAQADLNYEEAAMNVAVALKRAKSRQGKPNSRLSLEECLKAKPWTGDATGIWRSSRGEKWNGMAGAMARVALTISDLRGGEEVDRADILEARHYIPSPFSSIARSGMSFSKTVMPELNSTAMP